MSIKCTTGWCTKLPEYVQDWFQLRFKVHLLTFSTLTNKPDEIQKPTWTIFFIWLVQTVGNSITQPIRTDALASILTAILLLCTCPSLAHTWQFVFTRSQRPAIFTKVSHSTHTNTSALLVTYKPSKDSI